MTEAERVWIAVVGNIERPFRTNKVEEIRREAERSGATWKPSTLPVLEPGDEVPATFPTEEGRCWEFSDGSAILSSEDQSRMRS